MEKKIKQKSKKKNLEFLDVFEFIAAILFGFNLILLGCWALPQMPIHVQSFFAFTILGSALYIVFHALDKLGLMRDEQTK